MIAVLKFFLEELAKQLFVNHETQLLPDVGGYRSGVDLSWNAEASAPNGKALRVVCNVADQQNSFAFWSFESNVGQGV